MTVWYEEWRRKAKRLKCPFCGSKLKRKPSHGLTVFECINPECPLIYYRPKNLKFGIQWCDIPENIVHVDASKLKSRAKLCLLERLKT